MRACVLVLLGLIATGCGGGSPPVRDRAPAPRPPAGQDGGAPHPRGRAGLPRAERLALRDYRHGNPYASALAGEALVAFAHQYINWNARTVSADMRLLASESIGQARSAMELAAGETARDYELQRGGIANSGRVEAVAPLAGPGRRWVVVTRERTTATNTNAYQGLQPAWHIILATVVELWPGRWAISTWQPVS